VRDDLQQQQQQQQQQRTVLHGTAPHEMSPRSVQCVTADIEAPNPQRFQTWRQDGHAAKKMSLKFDISDTFY
jgi:hypothetical protein